MVGKQITLTGLSQKGKNRIREHGTDWLVSKVSDTVLFAPNETGPFLFIKPVGGDDKSSRWIKMSGDQNFGVENERTN